MTQYWITTHWPPFEDNGPSYGVYICEGRAVAGRDLRAGDKVLIYESGSCPDVLHKNADGSEKWRSHIRGRKGIIAIAELVEELYCDDDEPVTHYSDGSKRRWCWCAEGRMLNPGSCLMPEPLNSWAKALDSDSVRLASARAVCYPKSDIEISRAVFSTLEG